MKSNKKRILFVLAILTMALVLSCALVACNKTDSPDAPKKEFTITFDTRGGSEVKPITIAEGATITLPRNPTKEGYIFDGWYLSDEFIEKFNATQTISSNITVYAKWKEDGGNQDEKQSYTITFDTQGGSEVKSITIAEGETITLPSNPTKEGYIFDGWYLSEEFIEKFNATQTISSNITVYAKWKEDGNQDEKQTFTVTFDTQGGSEVKSLVLKEGETIPLPSNPTKEGYVFDGWYLDSSYTQAFDSTKRIDSNMVLYAKWKILDDGQSIIASDYFDINGLVLTMNKQKYIASSEDVFDLRNKFSTSTGSSWRAFTSPNCDQPTEITTRMANVSVGWNDIYVMVENLTTYENQIYRLKIYKYPTIVYRELNDGFLEIQSVSDCADVLFPDDKIDKITSVGENAFSSCPSLRTLQDLPKLTSIGPSAFANCKRLTSITIPDSVTSIGDYAFNGCTGLTSIEVPNSVTTIPAYAFNGCTGLTSITIPDSVTSIGGYAFNGCTGLTSIEVPNSMTTIPAYAFNGCTGLTSITIPNSVTTIPAYAFNGCTGLMNITIPDSVTSIGDYAFVGCTGLTSITVSENNSAYSSVDGILYDKNKTKIVHVPEAIKGATIPDSVKSIKEGAFAGCSSLESITIPFVGAKAGVASSDTYQYPFGYIFGTSSYTGGVATPQSYHGSSTSSTTGTIYYIPSSLKSVTVTGGNILYGAFYGCSGLMNITIPDSVTSIPSVAFYNCDKLTSITIPDSVTSIGKDAFRSCTGLTSVTIGNSVTSIGDSAFRFCYKLVEVYNKSTLSITTGSSSDGYVAYYAKNVYTNEGGSKLTTDENGYVIYTNGYAKILVAYTGTETELTLPSDITKIYQYAFYDCSGLTSVTIPDRVTSIGERAFYRCTGLTTVNWNATECTSVGFLSSMFEGCSNFATVNIGDNVKIIPAKAFRDCTGLTSVTIGGSVTSIGNYAFYNCSSLTSVTVPDSVTNIENYAFAGCSGLTSVTIGNGVTSIGEGAFQGCSSLESITIPFVGAKAGVASSDTYQYPFGYIFGTSSYTGGVATEQDYYGNSTSSTTSTTYYIPSSLKSVTVTGGNILYGAFYNCSGLTSVTIGNGVTSIGKAAFWGCSGLTSITIPDSVTSIGSYAFNGCSGLTSVTIGNGVTSIGGAAFEGCTRLTSITFNGTKAQWNAIEKGSSWKYYVPATKVVCTDGTISI